MTSTPVSLNESSTGSWIDINSASQIHSPMMNNESPEFLLPPFNQTTTSNNNNNNNQAEILQQNLGLISFQVERFLQEAQRTQSLNNNNGLSVSQQNIVPQTANNIADDNSGIYMSDTDASLDDLDSQALINSLRINQKHDEQMKIRRQQQQQQLLEQQHQGNSNEQLNIREQIIQPIPKNNGDCLIDQLSESLSILSRASGIGDNPLFDNQETNLQDLDWLWDWTSQPEYFAGQEWKVYAPKQEYLLRQRQLYNSHGTNAFSGQVISLLFLTNILSIIVGAGLTYSVMTRRTSI